MPLRRFFNKHNDTNSVYYHPWRNTLPLFIFTAGFRENVNENAIYSGGKGQAALHDIRQEHIVSDGAGDACWMHIQRSETHITHVAAFRGQRDASQQRNQALGGFVAGRELVEQFQGSAT